MLDEDVEFVLSVNLKGTWICSKTVLEFMKEQGMGNPRSIPITGQPYEIAITVLFICSKERVILSD
ncbi:hypothetical protein [Peribacillus sp. NPDC060253]|uniref:hypothetical protein n=1 Tax=Peribacillus sp. NPDC060253 TaxID=3347084 RepID=UPI00364B4CB5